MTARTASNTVFLSLLTSTEIGILFSPSDPGNLMREHLKASDYDTFAFWAGWFLSFGVLCSVCALYTNFIAWGIVSNIGDANVHAVLRSTIGMYAAQLPQRMVVVSIYLFFASFICLLTILTPRSAALIIMITFVFLMIHITSTYSALGRVMMDTGAMGNAVFTRREEERMDPRDLYDAWIEKVAVARQARVPVNRMYRIDYRATLAQVEMGGDAAAVQELDWGEKDEEEGKSEDDADRVDKEQ